MNLGRIPRLAAALLILGLCSGLAAQAQEPSRRDPRRPQRPRPEFGRLAVGLTAGVQWWQLELLEEFLDERAEFYAPHGYEFGAADFGVTGGYGLDLQFRLSRGFLARAQFEWTRVEWEIRDRSVMEVLGDRQPVSLTYRTRVGTNPLLTTLGLGWAVEGRRLRLGLAAGALIAPLRVEDILQVYFGPAGTETKIAAKGTGLGLDTALTLDYFTDVPMTLYLELFWRHGRTRVELEDRSRESTAFPGQRVVDFSGVGFRLGVRWI